MYTEISHFLLLHGISQEILHLFCLPILWLLRRQAIKTTPLGWTYGKTPSGRSLNSRGPETDGLTTVEPVPDRWSALTYFHAKAKMVNQGRPTIGNRFVSWYPPVMQKLFSVELTHITLTCGFFGTISNYVCSDFSIYNILTNSTADIPLFYKISATWSNHEGSLLLWCWLLSFNAFVFCISLCNIQIKSFSSLISFFFFSISSLPFVAGGPPEGAYWSVSDQRILHKPNRFSTRYPILRLPSRKRPVLCAVRRYEGAIAYGTRTGLKIANVIGFTYLGSGSVNSVIPVIRTSTHFNSHSNRLHTFQLKASPKLTNHGWTNSSGSCLSRERLSLGVIARYYWLWMTFFRCTNSLHFSRRQQQYFIAKTAFSASFILIFFIFFILCTSNPFLRTSIPSIASLAELNPILQDPVLAIHPPCIYAGYVASAIAFSLCMSTFTFRTGIKP